MTERTRDGIFLLAGLSILLMFGSAVCFLKYAWYAACVSGWYGLPSYAEQLKLAQARGSLYLWSAWGLQVATCSVLWVLIPLRHTELPQFLRRGARLGASLLLSTSGTFALAWLLSWFHYFHMR